MAIQAGHEKKWRANDDIFTSLETFYDDAAHSALFASEAINLDPDEPKSYREALAGPVAVEWKKFINSELESLNHISCQKHAAITRHR